MSDESSNNINKKPPPPPPPPPPPRKPKPPPPPPPKKQNKDTELAELLVADEGRYSDKNNKIFKIDLDKNIDETEARSNAQFLYIEAMDQQSQNMEAFYQLALEAYEPAKEAIENAEKETEETSGELKKLAISAVEKLEERFTALDRRCLTLLETCSHFEKTMGKKVTEATNHSKLAKEKRTEIDGKLKKVQEELVWLLRPAAAMSPETHKLLDKFKNLLERLNTGEQFKACEKLKQTIQELDPDFDINLTPSQLSPPSSSTEQKEAIIEEDMPEEEEKSSEHFVSFESKHSTDPPHKVQPPEIKTNLNIAPLPEKNVDQTHVLPMLKSFYTQLSKSAPQENKVCNKLVEVIQKIEPEFETEERVEPESPRSTVETPDTSESVTPRAHLKLLKDLDTQLQELLDRHGDQISQDVTQGLHELQGLVTQSIYAVHQQAAKHTVLGLKPGSEDKSDELKKDDDEIDYDDPTLF